MDKREAEGLLQVILERFRREPYDALVAQIGGDPAIEEMRGASGTVYQLEVECYWDDRRGGTVRVMGSIDDGGLSAIVPMTSSFIKAPDGSFIGE